MTSLPFTDLEQDAWYYEDVAVIVQAGLMNGVSETSFAPGQPVTRAMAAAILYRLSGDTADASAVFDDVDPTAWYAQAVAWASANGVVNGYGNGLFGPKDTVTREQLIAMFYRYYLALVGAPAAGGSLDGFSDADQVHAYALDAMIWAVNAGLIQGRPDQTIDPAGVTTRAELCAILVRFLELIG